MVDVDQLYCTGVCYCLMDWICVTDYNDTVTKTSQKHSAMSCTEAVSVSLTYNLTVRTNSF